MFEQVKSWYRNRQQQQRRPARRRTILNLEPLDARFLLSVTSVWQPLNPNNTNWSYAPNWKNGVVPGTGDTAVFDATGGSYLSCNIDENTGNANVTIQNGYAGQFRVGNGYTWNINNFTDANPSEDSFNVQYGGSSAGINLVGTANFYNINISDLSSTSEGTTTFNGATVTIGVGATTYSCAFYGPVSITNSATVDMGDSSGIDSAINLEDDLSVWTIDNASIGRVWANETGRGLVGLATAQVVVQNTVGAGTSLFSMKNGKNYSNQQSFNPTLTVNNASKAQMDAANWSFNGKDANNNTITINGANGSAALWLDSNSTAQTPVQLKVTLAGSFVQRGTSAKTTVFGDATHTVTMTTSDESKYTIDFGAGTLEVKPLTLLELSTTNFGDRGTFVLNMYVETNSPDSSQIAAYDASTVFTITTNNSTMNLIWDPANNMPTQKESWILIEAIGNNIKNDFGTVNPTTTKNGFQGKEIPPGQNPYQFWEAGD